jgi:hypothetical protein
MPVMEKRPMLYEGEKWVFEVRSYMWGWRRDSRTVIVKQVGIFNGVQAYYMLDRTPGEGPYGQIPVTVVKDLNLNPIAYLECPYVEPTHLKKIKVDAPLLNWPLFVGKEWEIEGYDELVKFSFYGNAKVLAYEEVITRAGTFKTFVISVRTRVTSTSYGYESKYPSTEQYWYSPAVKYFVKYEISSWGEGIRQGELIEYLAHDELL